MINILKKIAFEIKMFFMDLGWHMDMDRCWKSYPPSFCHRYTEEEDYFPMVVKQYIDHGALLLEQEYKYGHDFYSHLVDLEKSI